MEKVYSCGEMIAHMKEISSITIFMGGGNTVGRMGGFTKDSGLIIKWRDMVYFLGLTGENMRDNT